MNKTDLITSKEAASILGYASSQSIWLLKIRGFLTPISTPEPKLYFSRKQVEELNKKQTL